MSKILAYMPFFTSPARDISGPFFKSSGDLEIDGCAAAQELSSSHSWFIDFNRTGSGDPGHRRPSFEYR